MNGKQFNKSSRKMNKIKRFENIRMIRKWPHATLQLGFLNSQMSYTYGLNNL